MRMGATAGLGVAVAVVLSLSSCGGEPAAGGPGGTPSDASASRPAGMEIVRTGGIAGVHDTVRVGAAGRARVTTRDGRGRDCRPAASALDRLRAIDLASIADLPTAGRQIADAFHYSVRVGDTRATGSEGDDGRRAELVDAAAVVVTACLQGATGQVGGY